MPAAIKLTRPTPSEDELQASVVRALRLLLLIDTWTAMPMGWHQLNPAQAAKLVRLGAARGWPDIVILHGGRVMGLELKRQGARLTGVQPEVFPRLEAAGMTIGVCHSVDAVLAQLRAWGLPLRRHS